MSRHECHDGVASPGFDRETGHRRLRQRDQAHIERSVRQAGQCLLRRQHGHLDIDRGVLLAQQVEGLRQQVRDGSGGSAEPHASGKPLHLPLHIVQRPFRIGQQAARALHRDDLGRIAPGAAADLLAVDLGQAHLQPVADPIKTFAWNGRSSDIALSMVAGEILVENGRYTRGDEVEIVAAGAAAIEKVWDITRRNGALSTDRFARSF